MMSWVEHSKVAMQSSRTGQPPKPISCGTLWNLSADGLAKCRQWSCWCAPSTFTAKWPDERKLPSEGARFWRLQSTSGGSRETDEKELAVRPSSLPDGEQVVTIVTPVANRPRA